MANKLARIRWEMGQALLPEHFIAQEEALLADTILRFRSGGLPAYGIAGLKWNETFLCEGILSLQSITVVMPSGLLLDSPGNAVVATFNLNTPGTVTIPVYLHVIKPIGGTSDHDRGDEEEETISRMVYQLVLSSDQSHPKALETMKVGEFVKDPEGLWQHSEDFIPPLLQVGNSPYLKAEFDKLAQLLELFHYKITQEIAASYLSGESLFSAKQCLKSIYRIQRLMANLRSQIHIHPYYVYEALKNFYTEACFYRNILPENITDLYNHDQLAVCFRNIFEPLKKQMLLGQARSPYRPFELKESLYSIAFPPEVREAKDMYFLIQKSSVNKTFSFENMKLAGISRLSSVHRLALQGIPLKKIDRPPFQHSFGPEVDFYLIVPGEELDYALRELSVAFYDQDELKDMKFFLYWRLG